MMQHISNFYTLILNKNYLMMQKNILSGLILFCVVITGCIKNDTKCTYLDSKTVAPTTEIDSLQKILADSGITVSQHPSGFFYKISGTGTGMGITNLCSNITVTYKGSYFNGQVFDSTATGNAATFQLGQVIVGWQKGLPLISKGGDITLFIPPSLGYGANAVTDTQGNVIIPGNSYLVFVIHVVDIQ
jgi:FKBP-type peptidyl-prolyl cis-trans isomerase FkpA